MAMGKERINEMEIKAHEFILDRDFVLPGKNLIIITKTLKIPKNVEINLSGKHATLTTGAAKNGMIAGEDGEDGKNGIAGESSGNCLILTQTITDKEKENLRILLNGGNGSKGQDGGAGADGEDGVGAEVDMIEKDKIKIIFKNAVNFLTAGGFSRTLDSEYATVINDGPTKFANDSANFFATHSYRLYKGSDGKPGGEGGRKGIGGEGGKCGTLKFTIGGHDKSIEGEKVDN
uniref:Uncharacterized protein n=1 Tax=Panagrolaimus davidi TaxID=227884 RepID=A0A914QTZ2_9BILA